MPSSPLHTASPSMRNDLARRATTAALIAGKRSVQSKQSLVRRKASTATIRVRLEDGEPTALAKLCERFGYEQAAAVSDSPEERRAMESAILKIQVALRR